MPPDPRSPEPATAITTPRPATPNPARLLDMPPFRAVVVANVLAAIAWGSSRFVFVWLVGELTDWNPATAILGIVIGLPPLFLSAWAGSLADRLAPRRFGTVLFTVSAALFALTAIVIHADLMTVELAMVFGFATSIAPAMLVPLLQALVPAVVPTDRLVQGVALQNMAMMVSVIGGTFVGGAIIQAFGIAAGVWLLAIASVLGALRFATAPLPEQMAGAGAARRGAIRHAASIALGTEPLRSLLAITTVMGLAIATSTLLLPEFARDVLEVESLAAGALNAIMSLGMVATSMVLATRWTPARRGRVLAFMTSVALGGGLIALGATRAYAMTALVALAWGASGGIAMTLLRVLMQLNTPPELMGRVMGLSAMAQNGAFPVGAALLVALVALTSVATTMIIVGVICTIAVSAIGWRPAVRDL